MSTDPLTISVIAGAVGTVATAVLTKATWPARTKRLVALGVWVALAALAWWSTAYPASWELVVTQLTVVVGAGQLVYTILKPTGLLDWLRDLTTPGVAPYVARHGSDSTVAVPTTPEATATVPEPTSGDASPQAPPEGGVTAVPNTVGSSLEGEDPTA